MGAPTPGMRPPMPRMDASKPGVGARTPWMRHPRLVPAARELRTGASALADEAPFAMYDHPVLERGPYVFLGSAATLLYLLTQCGLAEQGTGVALGDAAADANGGGPMEPDGAGTEFARLDASSGDDEGDAVSLQDPAAATPAAWPTRRRLWATRGPVMPRSWPAGHRRATSRRTCAARARTAPFRFPQAVSPSFRVASPPRRTWS